MPPRSATADRKTTETQIALSVNVDGSGRASIATGIPFFDHMLEQVARHAMPDLDIRAKGDLQVDAHHQCETMFKAFARALRMALEPDPRAAGTVPSTKGTL